MQFIGELELPAVGGGAQARLLRALNRGELPLSLLLLHLSPPAPHGFPGLSGRLGAGSTRRTLRGRPGLGAV